MSKKTLHPIAHAVLLTVFLAVGVGSSVSAARLVPKLTIVGPFVVGVLLLGLYLLVVEGYERRAIGQRATKFSTGNQPSKLVRAAGIGR